MEVNTMKFEVPIGYDLVFEEQLEDLNGLGMVLTHKKTGAKVALISNEDDNKVFYIGFRTPPKNSTGVAHIIEHSVLCGSKNFPAKDPFVELAKGSLNTFLNAMTYPDKTVYPVASVNEQDFKNLMHVYMDAVLYPNIYEKKEIFMQEGWHYDLEDENAELKYNGVVYNEMKGAFSSPESMLFRTIQNSLFPDTTYGVESGGDPEDIPKLSYEEFIDFHKTYYHPSNSYIYLYGKMDFAERLAWLDQEYLSHFDRLQVNSEIKKQQEFSSTRELEVYYSVGEGEKTEDKTYLSYNMVIGDSFNKELTLSFQILDYLLLQTPGAPVKQALLDAGIGKDILGSFEDEIRQPIFTIIAKNTEAEKKNQFMAIIRDTLSELVAKGIDEKSLRAAINFYEFRYREADFGAFPKGLMYGLRILASWLYDDGKPFLHLKDNTGYAFLKEKIGTGYFEKLIGDYLLYNPHSSLVVLKPQPGLNVLKEEKLSKELAEYKARLSEEEIRKILDEKKRLKLFQETPSSKEDLERIPLLRREDISRQTQPLFNKELQMNDVKIIHHNLYTNGIAYLRLLFNLKELPQELLPYTSLLSLVLGYVNTKNYSYLELSNEINIHTGGIFTNVRSFSIKGSTDQYLPVFEFSAKVLYDKMEDAFRIINEMLYETILDDKKRLKEIVDEMKSKMQMRFTSSGHSVAVDRAMSYYSKHGLFKDITTGISFYKFLEELSDHFDEKADTAIERMKQLIELIFTRENLFVSFTSDEEGIEVLKQSFSLLTERLKGQMDRKLLETYEKKELTPVSYNEGFKTAMQVQYVARAGNFLSAGYPYTGALKVLKVILSYDYLWVNVRVKGGAYGCMCGFSGVDGDAYFTSYRDPGLKETNEIYEGIVDYVKNFDADERDITKYIIGTFSSLDAPLTPQSKGRRSLSMYLAGITEEDLNRERAEILDVTIEDIRGLANTVKAVLDADHICVIGNESKILESKDLFKEVKTLL